MRDRLIELLNIHQDYGTRHFHTEGMEEMSSMSNELIADYLLENGVIVPPCKVNDTVFVKYYGEIVNAYVTEFEINPKGIVAKVYIDPDIDREYDAEDIFLTRGEAEQALRKG